MLRRDSRVWNAPNGVLVVIECAVAFNIDWHTSSLPLWMTNHGYVVSAAGLVITFAIVSQLIGNYLSTYLIDRFGTRSVQLFAFGVIFLAAGMTSLADSAIPVLLAQLTRYACCECVLVTVEVVLFSRLYQAFPITDFASKEDRETKVKSSMSKLRVCGFGVASFAAGVGPWLIDSHFSLWRWMAPVITILGFVAVFFAPNVPAVCQSANLSGKPGQQGPSFKLDREVLKVVFPSIGIAICYGTIFSFLVSDLTPKIGGPAISSMYVMRAVAGWTVVPKLTEKLGEKRLLQLSVFLMMATMLLFYQRSLVGAIAGGIAFGVGNLASNTILANKGYRKAQNLRGKAVATGRLTWGAGGIMGSLGFGVARPAFGLGMETWLLLLPVLLLTLAGFRKSFQYWEEDQSRA